MPNVVVSIWNGLCPWNRDELTDDDTENQRCNYEKFFHDVTSFQRDEIELLYAVSTTSAEKIVMSCIIIIVFFLCQLLRQNFAQ